jgi:hypothetical protein
MLLGSEIDDEHIIGSVKVAENPMPSVVAAGAL